MSKRTWTNSTAFKTAATAVAASLVLFGSTASASPTPRHASVSGVTINVAIAYPAPPKAMLAKFTSQTGVKVNWSYLQWDDLQTKIAAAAEADTYFADVTDVDWSKVGEYYVTKWFLPLNQYFKVSSLTSQYGTGRSSGCRWTCRCSSRPSTRSFSARPGSPRCRRRLISTQRTCKP